MSTVECTKKSGERNLEIRKTGAIRFFVFFKRRLFWF
jgi:hypothetical protein